jgi:hypothetical protein
MTYLITPAHWDSQFFTFPIGNMELPGHYVQDELETTLREAHSKFRLVFVSVRGEGPDSLSLLRNQCPCYARKVFFKKWLERSFD